MMWAEEYSIFPADPQFLYQYLPNFSISYMGILVIAPLPLVEGRDW